MTVVLQALARPLCNKAVGLDNIPAEALRALDSESLHLVRDIFERRLNADEGWNDRIVEWMELIGQFIPKQTGDLKLVDSWRVVLIGSAVQKWYLSILRVVAEPIIHRLPPFIMGFRKGFQTAMLVEPLRIALRLTSEWDDPIAVACADAEAAFESIEHSTLVAGWEFLGAHPLLVAGFYREMSHAEAQIVVCGETGGVANLSGGGRPGDVATPDHWNATGSSEEVSPVLGCEGVWILPRRAASACAHLGG